MRLILLSGFSCFASFLFSEPLYLQHVRGFSAFHTGQFMLPLAVLVIVCAPWSGGLVGSYGTRPSLLIRTLMLTGLGQQTPAAGGIRTFWRWSGDGESRDHGQRGGRNAAVAVSGTVVAAVEIPYFWIYDLRSTYATRLSAGGLADEWPTQLLRQGDSQVFKRFADEAENETRSPREAGPASEWNGTRIGYSPG
jgi:hypothetical protein